MTTLLQHTQKMREKFTKSFPNIHPELHDELVLITDAIIRETLVWAEEQVVPESLGTLKKRYKSMDFLAIPFKKGYQYCRAQIITRFKEIQGL